MAEKINAALTRRKRSLEIPGVTHGNTPIPAGARVGPVIWSSGISGKDPRSGTLPASAEEQVRHAFQNLRTLVEAGGGALQDIVRITVFLKDGSLRPLVNGPWTELFPDPEDRPARHAVLADLQGDMLIQLEVVAVVQDST
jgi:2-iminobutanoate/2-iminopropanoate deaminase